LILNRLTGTRFHLTVDSVLQYDNADEKGQENQANDQPLHIGGQLLKIFQQLWFV
jgi:hypothetical protein